MQYRCKVCRSHTVEIYSILQLRAIMRSGFLDAPNRDRQYSQYARSVGHTQHEMVDHA